MFKFNARDALAQIQNQGAPPAKPPKVAKVLHLGPLSGGTLATLGTLAVGHHRFQNADDARDAWEERAAIIAEGCNVSRAVAEAMADFELGLDPRDPEAWR